MSCIGWGGLGALIKQPKPQTFHREHQRGAVGLANGDVVARVGCEGCSDWRIDYRANVRNVGISSEIRSLTRSPRRAIDPVLSSIANRAGVFDQ